jgi:hypothetical protein
MSGFAGAAPAAGFMLKKPRSRMMFWQPNLIDYLQWL